MPIVPISQRQQSAQGYQPAIIKPVSADLSPIAEGMDQAAKVWQKTVDDADNAAAYQFNNRAQSMANTMLWDKDSGLLTTRRGESAIGVAGDGVKQFDDWMAAERKNLKNQRQMELADKLAGNIREGMQRQLLQHQSREFESWQGETYKNAILSANETAGSSYADDTALDAGLINLKGAIATRLQSTGAPNLIGDEVRRAEGDYYGSAIAGALAADDYKRASDLLVRHGDAIDPKSRDSISKQLVNATKHIEAISAVDSLTAGENWTVQEADKALRERFASDPDRLAAARTEINYRDRARDDARREKLNAAMAPANNEIAEAERSGRTLSMSSPALLSLSKADPTGETYRKAVDLYAGHNRQLEDRALTRSNRIKEITGKNSDENAAALIFDMATNPDRYRGRSISGELMEMTKSGRLKNTDALRVQEHWDKIQKGESTPDMAVLSTAEQNMNDMLEQSYISGGAGTKVKRFTDLSKTEQADLKAKVRMKIDEVLRIGQSVEGRKYTNAEVRDVVTNAFRSATMRDVGTFGTEKMVPMSVVDTEGAGYRSIPTKIRTSIEAQMRKLGIPVTPKSVLDNYKAMGK